MEAVGFAVAISGLIDATTKGIQYLNDVKNAPKERAKLAREVASLLPLLMDLSDQVEDTKSTDPWFGGLQSLGGDHGPLMEFKEAMEELAVKSKPAAGIKKIPRSLCWTLDKNEVNSLLSRVERLKTRIGLVLQQRHFKLSLAMKKDIDGLGRTMQDVAADVLEIKTDHDAELKYEIYRWLEAPDPSSNHNTARQKQQPGTGAWFTNSKEFADWRTESNRFIWLHGIPGCGKTILFSTILQNVLSQYEHVRATAVAYFYFDFNSRDKQIPQNLVGSLVKQILMRGQTIPDSLQTFYSRRHQPDFGELKTILRQMMENWEHTYILIDAMDESIDIEILLEFIDEVLAWKLNGLHLLATSRRERDITVSLEPLVTWHSSIQAADVDPDIGIYVRHQLANDVKLKKWPAGVQSEIESTLINGAQGMFRWAVCQLESLRKCLKLDKLRQALRMLPKTLDETYDRILSNIDEDYEDDVLKILQWLCFSQRPMNLQRMVEVLAVDLNADRFDPEQRLPDPDELLTICSALVSVTATAIEEPFDYLAQERELRLSHYSVKEYLVSNRIKTASVCRYHIAPVPANFSIAKTCLIYLLQFDSPDANQLTHEFPLRGYAANYWSKHYLVVVDHPRRQQLDTLGYALMVSQKNCFINWCKHNSNFYDIDLIHEFRKSEELREAASLFRISALGVFGVLQLLLEQEIDVNANYKDWHYPLLVASDNGHEKTVKLLLERGAEINIQGGHYKETALIVASSNGHETIVRFLLEKGADLNVQDGYGSTALIQASLKGHETIVRLLLEKGADINVQNVFGFTALIGASSSGHGKIVRMLLEEGADINVQRKSGCTALIEASSRNHETIVRLLLEKGADINVQDKAGFTALIEASSVGHESIVRLLLEKGADINVQNKYDGTALMAASSSGHETVVRILLENGADISAQESGFTSLIKASLRGHKKVTRLLLEKRANVNAICGPYVSALIAAADQEYESIVRLLLDHGAHLRQSDWHDLKCLGLKTRQNLDKIYEEVKNKDQEAMIKVLMKGPLIHQEELFDWNLEAKVNPPRLRWNGKAR